MKNLIFISMLLIASLTAVCQDKEAEAKVYYTNAEEFFNKGTLPDYYQCINQLFEAEKVLGNTNSKILYMKIKAMQAFSNAYFAFDLDSAFTVFFKITDANTYPSDKYAEMIKAKNSFKQEINNDYFLKVGDSKFKDSAEGMLLAGKVFSKADYLDAGSQFFYWAAHLGNTEALDLMYQSGLYYGEHLLLGNAETFFLASSEFNFIPAMVSLGKLYCSPSYLGFQDCDKAEEWFKKAAGLNNIEAMYLLGLLYSNQISVAGEWDKLLATLDNVPSKWTEHGSPVYDANESDLYSPHCNKMNEEAALNWFIKAAESDNKKAYLSICKMGSDATDRNVRKRARETAEKFRAEKKFVN